MACFWPVLWFQMAVRHSAFLALWGIDVHRQRIILRCRPKEQDMAEPIFLNGGDIGDIDTRGDRVMARLNDLNTPMHQAITRLVMREIAMRRDPEFEGYLDESEDYEFLHLRLSVLVTLEQVWDDLRGQNEARGVQFIQQMEALEATQDRGEAWWRWARRSWLWDDYLERAFTSAIAG
jgi:hypothetical protein